MAIPKWQPLPSISPHIPTLLISPSFGSSSYTLHLTDLAHIWTESLDRKAIRRRSVFVDSDIDVVDGGEDQMAILISKLRAAFDASSPDHAKTTLKLEASSHGNLKLHATCTLPGNLRPLQWHYELSCASSVALAQELMLPLLQAERDREREIDSLVSILQDKDKVISRLLDKLEATGTALENVFTTLPGKRKATRAAAEARVRGLAAFREAEWRQMVRRDESERMGDALVREVFGGARAQLTFGAAETPGLGGLDGWWGKLGKSPIDIARTPAKSDETERLRRKDPSPMDVDEDDAEFQVQATPPRLASKIQKSKNHDSDMTESEADDDTGNQSAPKPSPRVSSPKLVPKPRMGIIGGRGKPGSKVSPKPSAVAPSLPNEEETDDEVASGSDREQAQPTLRKSPGTTSINGVLEKSSLKPPATAKPQQNVSGDIGSATDSDTEIPTTKPAQPPSTSLPSKKPRLGLIGGKSKPPVSASASSHQSPPKQAGKSTPCFISSSSNSPVENAQRTSKPVSPVRKLGLIGKKKASSTEDGNMGRPASRLGEKMEKQDGKDKEEREEEEDESKKAERRRKELEAELSRKAAAGPARKKRRF